MKNVWLNKIDDTFGNQAQKLKQSKKHIYLKKETDLCRITQLTTTEYGMFH